MNIRELRFLEEVVDHERVGEDVRDLAPDEDIGKSIYREAPTASDHRVTSHHECREEQVLKRPDMVERT